MRTNMTLPDDVLQDTFLAIDLEVWCRHMGMDVDEVRDMIDPHVTWGERGTITLITVKRLREIVYADRESPTFCPHFWDALLVSVG
jgi:hypothetical protein